MTIQVDAREKIETYLSRLSRLLRGMNEDEVRDIVEELRSHIMEKAIAGGEVTTAGVDAALASLGSPEELASEYMTDELLTLAQISRSPAQIVRSLLHWANLSVVGFFVLLSSLLGYLLGFVFLLCALLKPLHPQTAGLWIWEGAEGLMISLRLGFGAPPAGAKEVLGWWMVPLGLAAGCGLVVLTTRFALWSARRFRPPRTVSRLI